MEDNSVIKVPPADDGDADIDERKEFELNGNQTLVENDNKLQDTQTGPVKASAINVCKEVITIDDDDHEDEQNNKIVLRETVGGDDRAPQVGMVFASYDEVCNYYKCYALHIGFGVAVKKSQFTKSGVCRRLILACSKGGKGRENACYQARRTAKTDCQASIVLKLWGDGLLHVVEAYLDHNHPVSPSNARFFRCYKNMSGFVGKELIVQPSRQGISQSNEKEFVNSTKIGRLKLGEGDDESMNQFFARMQNKNPNFFYLVDLDKHGRLRNLFWADARSRAAYRYYGDVVSFDTTCVTEKYDIPLVLFVGVNHHGQLVLLGCGLLSDETADTYMWLFKAWLTCMLGCRPNSVITGHCKAIQDAVAEVFPGVRHRICLSHIIKQIPEKLKGFAEFKGIKKALKKLAYDSLRVDEFEQDWKKMVVEYGLEGNEWLNSLYGNRHLWVPMFLKDTFWNGLSITQCGESISGFFDGSLYPRTTLKNFFSKYDTILQNKYKKEEQADSDSFHKTPLLISKFYMEEQLSKVYTLNVFRKFQDELKATMYCHVTQVNADGPILAFEVKECSYMEDGKRTESKDHRVVYNTDELEVQCVCGYFQFWGILCRHALSVFKLQQVFEIPSHYVLDRWKKEFKWLHALALFQTGEPPNNVIERYEHLSMRFLQLAELGFVSDDRYQIALKMIREVEKSLLDDTSSRNTQPMLLSFGAKLNENSLNLLVSQLGSSKGNGNSNSLQVKRRGRPPKKPRESNVVTEVRSHKEQDFLRPSLIGNVMLQSNPSASESSDLVTRIGIQGGINLMEEDGTNDLSFGTHFGLQVNHQHHGVNQARLQSSNLLQNPYGQQMIGNQLRMQWNLQNMFPDQIPKAPTGQRTG